MNNNNNNNNNLPVDTKFPIWGLLPKKETGVVSFLTKYPLYDGRDIIIAILDSGVDPGAPGLQKTSEGKVKVIERFDCSGCGDINTNTIVTAEEGVITGLTGRKLKIPSNWNNPSGNYRIGVKNAYDLYPDRLKDKIKAEYKKKKWDEGQREILSDLHRELNNFDNNQQLPQLQQNDKIKYDKEDCESKIEILTNLEKKFTDAGPVYDCILFHDGTKWMCCINTNEINNNDLTDCPLLGEYSVTHEYLPLTKLDNLNISFNVHENGDILELVSVCSSHGTHVASIASAYFPGSPEQNGIAPGAQIISLTIGDGRLGSMETGTSLMRAMIKLIELKKLFNIHVINMSYGEHAHWVDTGRVGDLVNEIVNKYGVIWISSAGNNGPALGTISTPSDINEEPIISVGAYVSPEMMIAEYAMKQKLPGSPYTWSSRGPTIDGGIGVHVCAPGGAITSVPNFTLRCSQLMNGTSMASPNCAGAICLLLSGLIQENLTYSPYLIRKALENTANFIDGVEILAQGAGLIQVDKAYDYLLKYHAIPEKDVRFLLQCGSSKAKGIYLRTKNYTNKHTFKINVEPHFFNEDEIEAEKKIQFNMKLVMTCSSDFVEYPQHLDLSNLSRIFTINIDTSSLTEGLYTTFVNAYDTACIQKGPVFKIPITVIQSKEIVNNSTKKYSLDYRGVIFKPNTIKRHYLTVPNGATWAMLKLTANQEEAGGHFVIHTMQCMPRQHCKTVETVKHISVSSKTDSQINFAVKDDNILEIVIAKYWANIGEANLNYTIDFFGIKPNQPFINMHSADGIHCVELKTLQGEEVAPIVNLKMSVQILKPIEAKVCPLTARDIIPPSRQIYELLLTYHFNIIKSCEVQPNFALLSDMLYESEYESQLWMLFDSNKQLLGTGDAYPSKYTVKLERGDYVIRLQVRHDKKEYLEKINEAPLLLQQKLSSIISLDVFWSYTQALVGGKKGGFIHNSNPNSILPIYIAPLPSDKFPGKNINHAHYLTGTISYAKDEIGKKVDTYPMKFFLYDTSSPKKSISVNNNNNNNNSTSASSNSEKTKFDDFNESLRDFKSSWITKLDRDSGEKLFEELTETHPNHLSIYSSFLQLLEPIDKRILPSFNDNDDNNKKLLLLPSASSSNTAEDLKKSLDICNAVLDKINESAILAQMAVKTDLRADAAKHKTQNELHKNAYIECLSRKGIILCRMSLSLESNEQQEYYSQIWKNWKCLVKFIDPAEAKIIPVHVLYFAIWHSFIKQHYGRLVKYLFRLQEDKPTEEVEKKIIELFKLLEWNHVVDYMQRQLPSKFPSAYRPF